MPWLHPDHRPILPVRVVDGAVALPVAAVVEEPEVRERGEGGAGDGVEGGVEEVWEEVVCEERQREEEEGEGGWGERGEEGEEGHGWCVGREVSGWWWLVVVGGGCCGDRCGDCGVAVVGAASGMQLESRRPRFPKLD